MKIVNCQLPMINYQWQHLVEDVLQLATAICHLTTGD